MTWTPPEVLRSVTAPPGPDPDRHGRGRGAPRTGVEHRRASGHLPGGDDADRRAPRGCGRGDVEHHGCDVRRKARRTDRDGGSGGEQCAGSAEAAPGVDETPRRDRCVPTCASWHTAPRATATPPTSECPPPAGMPSRPGHAVRLRSRWPMTRGFVTCTPGLYACTRRQQRDGGGRVEGSAVGLPGDDLGHGALHRGGERDRREVTDDRHPEGLLVEATGLGALGETGEAALAPLVDPPVAVDEEVVADVAPAPALGVKGEDRTHERRSLRGGVAVGIDGVVDDGRLESGELVRLARHEPLVGAPLRPGHDRRAGHRRRGRHGRRRRGGGERRGGVRRDGGRPGTGDSRAAAGPATEPAGSTAASAGDEPPSTTASCRSLGAAPLVSTRT